MGQGRLRPGTVAFCVHYGTAFAGFAAALGHRARGVAVTDGFNSHQGHFMAGVWDDGLGKWVLHDPTLDAHFETAQPLSLRELTDLVHGPGADAGMLRTGPAQPQRFRAIADRFLGWRVSGVWTRNDYVADPPVAPPAHGWVIYAETGFVWYVRPGSDDVPERAPMFPYRTTRGDWFDAR